MISGAVLGSCFPPLFGGECSGIPKDCKPCIDVCTGYSDQELVVHLDEDGNIIYTLCLRIVPFNVLLNKKSLSTSSWRNLLILMMIIQVLSRELPEALE